MKILHTADLHLGKKLNKASRLDEQCAVIKELAELADVEDIDVILIAGDVFDASVPPAEAERVFYRSILTNDGCARRNRLPKCRALFLRASSIIPR